jgi:uncharacterized protein (TIGR00251 family)
MIEHSLDGNTLTFKILAVPRASRSEVTGEHDGVLRVRIAAAPVGGAANKELVKVLSRYLGVPKSDVEITAGSSSRRKTVAVSGDGAAKAAALIRGLS